MDEFDFIKKIQQPNYKQSSLIKGIGDDAAVFRQNYQDIVTAVDTFVENIHFSDKTMDPFHIGYRAVAANISDMAAMGCLPSYYMVSIVIPKHWDDDRLMQVYEGMNQVASEYAMDLIGGDTVSGKELVISVTIIGFVEKGKARYRANAMNGDIVFATGTLGDAAAGLHVLISGVGDEQQAYSYLKKRHQMPTPRVAFARELDSVSRLVLNDVSDGIANESAEIAEASDVTITLQYDAIPTHAALLDFALNQQRDWKLFGGEDFELIGTVPAKDWPYILTASEKTGTPVSKIGQVSNNPKTNGSVFLVEDNQLSILHKAGYTHLK